MADLSLEQRLRGLLEDTRQWVLTGVVTAIESHDAFGYLLTVQAGDLELQARLVSLSYGGSGRGVWVPVAVGAEVLVLCPDGDLNRAVALPGLPSTPAPPPSGWANDHVEIVDEGGTVVRLTESGSVQAVVTEDLLGDLNSALSEVQAALAALGLPTVQLAALIAKLPLSYRSASFSVE